MLSFCEANVLTKDYIIDIFFESETADDLIELIFDKFFYYELEEVRREEIELIELYAEQFCFDSKFILD